MQWIQRTFMNTENFHEYGDELNGFKAARNLLFTQITNEWSSEALSIDLMLISQSLLIRKTVRYHRLRSEELIPQSVSRCGSKL
jgi:hypothetical protein